MCVQTSDWDQYYSTCRVETGIMRWVVLWDTACNFIISATTLTLHLVLLF